MKKQQEYEMIWRNKWLTADAKTIDDMIQSLENAVAELKELKANNVTLDPDGMQDDYACFKTTDKKVAKKFGFEKVEEDEEMED